MEAQIKDLHQNFILIHHFLYPNEGIKQWLLNDQDYHGNYHDNWDSIMAIVEKLGDDYGWTVFETLKFLEKTYFPTEGLSDMRSLYDACILEIKSRL